MKMPNHHIQTSDWMQDVVTAKMRFIGTCLHRLVWTELNLLMIENYVTSLLYAVGLKNWRRRVLALFKGKYIYLSKEICSRSSKVTLKLGCKTTRAPVEKNHKIGSNEKCPSSREVPVCKDLLENLYLALTWPNIAYAVIVVSNSFMIHEKAFTCIW